jgi:hypothetical protein
VVPISAPFNGGAKNTKFFMHIIRSKQKYSSYAESGFSFPFRGVGNNSWNKGYQIFAEISRQWNLCFKLRLNFEWVCVYF